ncbi:AzlC family ABC transporter permease [Aureimonas sp. D3]|uniref:AzlC family ABC transporter permease n=1 Tax=Aureimonas sp. D3 TaxID=1638164 RepID=UPI001FCD3FAF|nr:AzlC family ABC transporter permease [Aureimonas sp. D3]
MAKGPEPFRKFPASRIDGLRKGRLPGGLFHVAALLIQSGDGMDRLQEHEQDETRLWVWRGIRQIASAPALILVTAHLGFAGLARDAGLNWFEASFMVFSIWALPANIILLGSITAGLSLVATAFAVGLSSLRLMPMVMSLMPDLRAKRTRTSTLLVLSHFVAVTAWVVAMERLPDIPRRYRTAFFAGFGITLTVINTLIVAFAFNLMGQFPALVTGALAFLTPVYFLTSLYGSARDVTGRLALFLGMVAIVPANRLAPDFDILIAGIAAGLLSLVIGRLVASRSPE